MDIVNVITVISVILVVILIIFESGVLNKLVGIEYFEEKYTFQEPVSITYVRNLFHSLQFKEYGKKFYEDLGLPSEKLRFHDH